MKRPSWNKRGRAVILAGALSAVAIPASAFGAQYGYFVSQQLSASGAPNTAEEADLGRVNIATGAVDRAFVPAASVTSANGGAGVPLQIMRHDSSRLVASGNYIYWTAKDLGLNNQQGPNYDTAIGRMSTSGGDIQPSWHLFPYDPQARGRIELFGIAASGSTIYFSYMDSNGNYGIGKVNMDGTGEDLNLVPSQSRKIGAIAVDGSTLYWVDEDGQGSNGKLQSCTLGTCTPTIRGDLNSNLTWGGIGNSLALVGTTAYAALIPSYPEKFGAFDLQATPPTTGTALFGMGSCSTFANPFQLTADDTYGYITGESQPGANAYLCRHALSAGSPENWGLVYTAAQNANGLSTDSLTIAAPSPPSISAVNPSTGTTAGGTSVTITGSGFTGATAVTFGGIAAASFTVDSDTQITATTPAGSAGAVAIAVTTASGTDTEAGAFTYEAPATPSTPAASPVTTPPAATQNETRSPLVTGNAGVDLVAPPTTTVKGETARVVTRMELEKVGRYTFLYEVDPGSAASSREMARAGSNRVPMLRGTRLGDRRLNTVHTAAVVNTTETGARLTTIALLKKAKVKPGMRLRVIHRAADGTLTESFIRSR